RRDPRTVRRPWAAAARRDVLAAMTDELLDAHAILAYLGELAEELPDDVSVDLVVVGGSMLALRGLRHATRDVDSARMLTQVVQGAAARVAQRHDLTPHWLNSSAEPFAGSLEPNLAEDTPVLDHPRLRVYLATAEAVFLMKLYADRPQDHADLVALWPLCE